MSNTPVAIRHVRRRRLVACLAVLLLGSVLAGCQTSAAGRRCRGTGVAQDATHVLQCRNGRYARLMTKADALRLLAAFQARSGGGAAAPGGVAAPGAVSVRAIELAAAAPAGSAWGGIGCYDGNGDYSDIWFTGAEGTAGNVRGSNSRNGTCSEGASGYLLTVVRAPDQAGAVVQCRALAGLGAAFNLPTAGFAFPIDAWGCE